MSVLMLMSKYKSLTRYADSVDCVVKMPSASDGVSGEVLRKYSTLFERDVGLEILVKSPTGTTSGTFTWDCKEASYSSKNEGLKTLSSFGQVPVLSKMIQPWFLDGSIEKMRSDICFRHEYHSSSNYDATNNPDIITLTLGLINGSKLVIRYSRSDLFIKEFEWLPVDQNVLGTVVYKIYNINSRDAAP